MLAPLRLRLARLAAAAPRAYWYVWWGTLVNRLGGFVLPLLTIYLIEVRRLSVAEAGGIVSVFGAGSVAASIAGGQLSDRLGRKSTMVISLFGGAVALTVLGVVRDLAAITAMVGVVGFVGELYRPAVLAFVADVVPPAQRVQAYGLLHWAINIGFAFATIVGGLLAEVDFTILFLADAATMAVYGVIVLVAVPETRPETPPAAARSAVARPARAWFLDGPFVALILLTLLLALLPHQAGSTLSAHMTRQGFTPAAFGAVMGVNGALIIALQPSLAAWSAKRDPSRILAIASLFYGIGISLHGLAQSVPMHAVATSVWTLGEIFEAPSRAAVVAAMAPADARGRYQGAVVMAFGVSAFVAPKLGTWTWEHVSADALWSACLVVGVVLAFAHLAAAPARRRRMAAAAAAEASAVSAPSPSGSS